MDTRTEERLRALLTEAAALVPNKGGRLLLEYDNEGSYVWGDRMGFLRLGLGLATGAILPSASIPNAPNALDTGVDQLIERPPRTDFQFCWADDWDAIKKRAEAEYSSSSLPASIVGIAIGTLCLIAAAVVEPHCESTRCILWLALGVVFGLAFLGGGGLAFFHWLREK